MSCCFVLFCVCVVCKCRYLKKIKSLWVIKRQKVFSISVKSYQNCMCGASSVRQHLLYVSLSLNLWHRSILTHVLHSVSFPRSSLWLPRQSFHSSPPSVAPTSSYLRLVPQVPFVLLWYLQGGVYPVGLLGWLLNLFASLWIQKMLRLMRKEELSTRSSLFEHVQCAITPDHLFSLRGW